MKNDYLWEKTGNDPDIERLENLLSGFRYMEAAEAASNVVEFPSKAKRSLQPWIFAMAACIAIGAVALTAWDLSLIGREPTPVQTGVSVEEAANPEPPIPNITAKTAEPDAAIPTPELAVTVKKSRTPPRQKYKSVSRKQTDRHDTPRLTKEEKYAYGQLMLALAITSSKWQIVQDSINGVDEIETNDR